MVGILLIAALGLMLAHLSKGTAAPARPVAGRPVVPDDVWAAFEATAPAADADGSVAVARRTTVGGMVPGETGFVAITAAAADAAGDVWVDAAAVVHFSPGHGRVRVRRGEAGLLLEHVEELATIDVAAARTHLRVTGAIR